MLSEAAKSHDDDWLKVELTNHRCFKSGEVKHTRTGKITVAHTPFTAAETLAEGEFNRYYMRGVCLRAIDEGIAEVMVYRGKFVEQPRAQFEALAGTKISVPLFLGDLRCQPGVQTKSGLPCGPNSGLTICL